MARVARTIKVFNGVRYKRRFISFTKAEAKRLSDDLRKEGYLARVTKIPRLNPVWQVWQGPKRK